MTMHDLWIVLDKAQVDHSQLKVKKDLRAAVERLPPLPPAGTRAAGGDGSAAAAAAAAAGDDGDDGDGGGGTDPVLPGGPLSKEAFKQMLERICTTTTASLQEFGASFMTQRHPDKESTSFIKSAATCFAIPYCMPCIQIRGPDRIVSIQHTLHNFQTIRYDTIQFITVI
jgi:hypothetical protein